MDAKFYYLVEYELIVYFRSMLEGDKCLMDLCTEKKLNIFCHKHLKNPDKDPYKFNDHITATPTIFFKPKGLLDRDHELNNSLSSTFHCTDPLNLRSSRCVQVKIKNQLKIAFDKNRNLEISRLVYGSYLLQN